MNWQEIAGSVVNALRNAGVKKDVIDLQEKQVAIFRHEIAVLTSKLEESESQRANLQVKITELEQELERLRPGAERLLAVQDDFLKVMYRQGAPIAMDSMASIMRLEYEIVEHHRGILQAFGMIRWTGRGAGDWGKGLHTYELTDKGTAYVVEKNLVQG